MNRYYISTNPMSDGRYAVHRDDCPLIPDEGRRHFLGIFTGREEALAAAAMLYGPACFCRFCLHEQKSDAGERASEIKSASGFITAVCIKPSFSDALFCPVS